MNKQDNVWALILLIGFILPLVIGLVLCVMQQEKINLLYGAGCSLCWSFIVPNFRKILESYKK